MLENLHRDLHHHQIKTASLARVFLFSFSHGCAFRSSNLHVNLTCSCLLPDVSLRLASTLEGRTRLPPPPPFLGHLMTASPFPPSLDQCLSMYERWKMRCRNMWQVVIRLRVPFYFRYNQSIRTYSRCYQNELKIKKVMRRESIVHC